MLDVRTLIFIIKKIQIITQHGLLITRANANAGSYKMFLPDRTRHYVNRTLLKMAHVRNEKW